MAKILIAEDKLAYAQLLAEKLQQCGHIITAVVRTCKAAIESIKTNPPDLVLLDVRLSDSCGLDVLGVVKVRALVMAGPVRPMPLATAITRGGGRGF